MSRRCDYELKGKHIIVYRLLQLSINAPREIDFRPTRKGGYRDCVTPFAVYWDERINRATGSEILDVVGCGFYTTDLSSLHRQRLLWWLDGLLTTEQAASWGSKQITAELGLEWP